MRSCFALLALVLGVVAPAFAAGTAKPNIVYILADDMGVGDISAYNPASAWRTPHLDRLAQRGMLFTDAHSSSAVCTPSRYSIMTGRYAWRSRLKAQVTYGYSAPVIETERLTTPSFLRRHGYATAMLGKWHLGFEWARKPSGAAPSPVDPPNDEPKKSGEDNPAFARGIDYEKPFRRGPTDVGFDSFLGLSASLDMPPYVWLRDDRVLTPPVRRIPASKAPALWRAGPVSDDLAHVDVLPRLTREALAYLRRQGGHKAFFLYLALPAPHTPIVPSKEFAGRTGTTPYGDFCVQVDAVVGEIMQALEAQKLDRNTLVIFTADNGCSPAANFTELKRVNHDPQPGLRGAKADIYEGGHRVPFIACWPDRVPAGARSAALVGQVDLLATCAAIVSAALPANAGEDSISILPVLTSGAKQVRASLVHHSINGSFAIREGAWKLCLCPDSGGWSDPRPGRAPAGSPPFQLFNLQTDPAETKNLYADHPEIVKRLGELLKTQVLSGRSTPGAPQSNTGGNDWPQLAWMKQSK